MMILMVILTGYTQWLIKAGKIVPAMITTTSIVAAYQTLQFLMVLKNRIYNPKEI